MLEELIYLDQWLFEQVMLWLNPAWLTQAAEFWVRPEKYYLVFLLLFIYALRRSPRETLIFCAALVILLIINEQLTDTIKHLVARPRPGIAMGIYYQKNAFGFPSAHSSNTMAAAIFLYQYRKHRGLSLWLAWLAIGYSIFVGLGRIIANYHFPLDVLCGWLLGARLADIFWFYYRNYVIPKLFLYHTTVPETPLRFF